MANPMFAWMAAMGNVAQAQAQAAQAAQAAATPTAPNFLQMAAAAAAAAQAAQLIRAPAPIDETGRLARRGSRAEGVQQLSWFGPPPSGKLSSPAGRSRRLVNWTRWRCG